ncbi:unnamed protein product [Mytilus edulis]|uniref:Reverse transcriptase domain-containing protein n=1 Tax=Mytilus edulis TaxID=6550 RepID=A0A8S3T7H7_MYTED|nr:unnamed protein product [Mytilus edulis]
MDFNLNSPYVSIPGSDYLLDGSLPLSPPQTTSTLTGVSTTVSGIATYPTLSQGSAMHFGGVPTSTSVTHTLSRSVNSAGTISSVPGTAMGLNLPGSRPPLSYCGYMLPNTGTQPLPSWSQPPWPQSYPYGGFMPNQPGFWPYRDNFYGPPSGVATAPPLAPALPVAVSLTSAVAPSTTVPDSQASSSSHGTQVSDHASPLDGLQKLLLDFGESFKAEFSTLSSRMTLLENRVSSHQPSPAKSVECDEREDDELSVSPGSHERAFLTDEDVESSSSPKVSKTAPEPSSKSAQQPPTKETEDPPSLKDLRDKVYTLMRDEAHIPFLSPSKPKKPSSTFEASCGISQDTVTSHNSFPESGHMTFALQFINEGIANSASEKVANNNISGFGMSSFSDQVKYKDFDIFDSSLGRLVPSCDKSMSSLLGKKPVDGLRLTQPVWSKTENLLRSASQVLGTAEHFLAATGHLLNSEDSVVPAEVRSFLLQLDKALGSSQLLLMGSIANCTLSKRAEFLENISIAEPLKDSLLKSPLSDKMFGLPLQRVQEELSKNPPPVKVSVQVTNGKRSVNATSSSNSTSASGGPPSSAKKRKNNYGKPQNKPNNSGKSSVPISLSHTQDPVKCQLLSVEVDTMLQKAAIEEVSILTLSPGFYSRLFLVPKKTGGMRPVIDLSILNKFLIVPHFKMETNRSIRASILPGMWTTSLDLSDAYFHIPISKTYRKYLRFVWNNKVFQFKALPFGLSTAPLAFTKIMQAAIAHLHSLSIQIHSYLDDSLLKEFCPIKLRVQTDLVINCFLSLGFLISWKKSEIIPSQDFVFLGEHFLTSVGLVLPPEEKFTKLCQKIHLFLTVQSVTARQFLQLLGLLNSLADVIPLGRLHIRPLQFYLHKLWIAASQEWEALIPITQPLFPHLQWWLVRENVMRGLCLSPQVPSLTLFTDASTLGWGAYLEGLTISGVWSPDLLEEHINVLEMKAVLFALNHFQMSLKNQSVILATDNTTVVAYLKNQGGTHSPSLYQIARDILLLCFQLQVHLVVRHIAGHLNILADTLSRSLAPVNTEWELLQVVFKAVTLHWGSPQIDLFATSLNHKLLTFVSPVPDPKSFAVDAMSLSWKGMFGYAFPPFRFLSPVLQKIAGENCKIIVIAPAWPKQSWFPDLLRLSCACPLVLPLRPDLLSQIKGKVLYQNPEKLHLHAWLLSGLASEREVFLKEQPSISQSLSETPLALSMMQNALASGRRRSEIHAFSISDACLRFNRDKSSVTLLTDPAFLAKNQIPDKGAEPVVIPALPSDSISVLLCPVRILSIYLERTCSLRSVSNSRLFIPIKKGISDLSVKTISTWICKCISLAYGSSKAELLNSFNVKAHDVRGISTSWALFNSASLEEVLSAGFWRNENSFISHYLQSMATFAESLYSLGPIVSAQRLNFPPVSSVTGDSALR